MNILDVEKPEGVIVQFGGQTPLNLAMRLHQAGVPIIGTGADAIDLAEDRKRFGALLRELGIPQPENGMAATGDEAKVVAERIGYPVLVRPSYVLGGRAMAIVYGAGDLEGYVREAVKASPEHPILVDRFLEDAFEVDVDALGDGERVVIGGILQHIEQAGIHSGDSAMVLPTYKIAPQHLETIRTYTGEVMGLSEDFGIAFAKSQIAAGFRIPTSGAVFISVNDFDKPGVLPHAKALREMGFLILATRGTVDYLAAHGVDSQMVYKVNEGRPNVVDFIKDKRIAIVFNTPLGRESFFDDGAIRKSATL